MRYGDPTKIEIRENGEVRQGGVVIATINFENPAEMCEFVGTWTQGDLHGSEFCDDCGGPL